MSTRPPASPTSPPRRGRRVGLVLATGLATFFTVLNLLVYQVRTGHDPALGGTPVALVAAGHSSTGAHRLVTSTSGASRSAAPATGGHPAATITLTTHTSGAGRGDD